jgi:hypothetical protein
MRTPTTRIVSGRIGSTGTVVSGRDFVPTRTSAGAYSVTLPPDFRLMSATVSGSDGGGYVLATVTSQAGTGFTYACRNPATNGTLDAGVAFVATSA